MVFFFSDRYSDGRGNHRQKESRQTYSVGKKITDELLITHRRNIFVGKTVKSCSDFSFLLVKSLGHISGSRVFNYDNHSRPRVWIGKENIETIVKDAHSEVL
jgi:hypothetical protein